MLDQRLHQGSFYPRRGSLPPPVVQDAAPRPSGRRPRPARACAERALAGALGRPRVAAPDEHEGRDPPDQGDAGGHEQDDVEGAGEGAEVGLVRRRARARTAPARPWL